MSDNLNKLVRLGGDLEDAKLSLQSAIRLSLDLIGEDPEEGDPGWPAMGQLHDQLTTMLATLETLPGEEIDKAIDAADSELDRLSDLADGLSY